MTPRPLLPRPPRTCRLPGSKLVSVFALFSLAATAAAAAAGMAAAPAAAQEPRGYELQGPLRERDMMAFDLTRLEMMPLESSAALAEGRAGWSLEAEITHVNTFAMSGNVLNYLARRGGGRRPVTRRDAANLLALKGDLFYVDGEFDLVSPTVHYKFNRRTSFFVTWPAFSYSGGTFDAVIEGFHHSFGLGNGNRQIVARNEFNVIYRVGRDQVVETGAPAGGLSDPIAGVRCRLLPPSSRWDLIVASAVKFATRSRSALSTGASDVGMQLALHRTFGHRDRQAVYLDLSAVQLGGALPDRRVDRRRVPSLVVAYELGLTRHTSTVAQAYTSPSVFLHSKVPDLLPPRYEVLVGLRSRRGALTWYADFIENIIHLSNTPDVGAQLGLAWRFSGR
jgi:hypothetical protein